MDDQRDPIRYEIHVQGQVGDQLVSAFPELHCSIRANATVLTGTFLHRSALRGVLNRIESLGLDLIEVRRVRTSTEAKQAAGSRVRLTAAERRDAIVDAAIVEFAAAGLAATSTDAIARRAGVSQPYLFQLFGTKKKIFLEAIRVSFERTGATFEAAHAARAEGLGTESALERTGEAGDRVLLRLELHAYSASCQDPEIRAAVREASFGTCRRIARAAKAGPPQMQRWLAERMLASVVAAVSDAGTPEELLSILCEGASDEVQIGRLDDRDSSGTIPCWNSSDPMVER